MVSHMGTLMGTSGARWAGPNPGTNPRGCWAGPDPDLGTNPRGCWAGPDPGTCPYTGISSPVKKTEMDKSPFHSPSPQDSPRLSSFTQHHRPVIAVHSGEGSGGGTCMPALTDGRSLPHFLTLLSPSLRSGHPDGRFLCPPPHPTPPRARADPP